jgi:hypothetical protein
VLGADGVVDVVVGEAGAEEGGGLGQREVVVCGGEDGLEELDGEPLEGRGGHGGEYFDSV